MHFPSLTHRPLTPREPTPGSPASPSLESVLEENKESSTGLTGQAGESEAIPEDGDGKEAHLLENKEDPQSVSVQSMSDFCNKRPIEEFPVKPKASPATGCHESGWGHAPWFRWLHSCVTPVLGLTPTCLVCSAPTSAACCASCIQSACTHKYSLSCITYTVNLHTYSWLTYTSVVCRA